MHLDHESIIQTYQPYQENKWVLGSLLSNEMTARNNIGVITMKYLPKLDVNLIGNIVVALLVVKVLAKLLG